MVDKPKQGSWLQAPEVRAKQAANRAAKRAQYDLICQSPTKKYPDGRTGTVAGFMAHVHRDDTPCDPCRQAWNTANSARRDPARRAEQRIVAKYGITKSQFAALLALQGGQCAICRKHAGEYVVDHDHACCPGIKTCGKCIRGLLCSPCNKALGHFQDDIERLRAAIVYLEAHADGRSYLTCLR